MSSQNQTSFEYLGTWADSVVLAHNDSVLKLYRDLSYGEIEAYHQLHFHAAKMIGLTQYPLPGNSSWFGNRVTSLTMRVLSLTPEMIHTTPTYMRELDIFSGNPLDSSFMSVVPRIGGKHLGFYQSSRISQDICEAVSGLLEEYDVPIIGIGDKDSHLLDPSNIKVLGTDSTTNSLNVVVTDIGSSIRGTLGYAGLLRDDTKL